MIELKNLSVKLGKKQILKEINLQIREHSFTVVLGKNGAGKSTLMNCMNQQISYTGQICYKKQDLKTMKPKKRARLISFLPQNLASFHLTVKDLVAMGRSPYLDFTQHLSRQDEEKIEEAIKMIGIESLFDRYVDELSGGERQKAYLAMIYAQDTEVLVLDEPTTHMDMTYEAEFLNLLVELKEKSQKTILVIMHNLNQAMQIADHLIILDEGRVCFEGTRQEALDQQIFEQIFNVHRYEVQNRNFFVAE